METNATALKYGKSEYHSKPHNAIKRKINNQDIYNFFSSCVDINSDNTNVINTNSQFNIDYLLEDKNEIIINLQRLNDVKRINKFMEKINAKLINDGMFMGCFEPQRLRKKRLFNKFIKPFNFIYYCSDFIFKRVFPKLPVTKKIYFFITGGRNRVISKAEMFGRLYSCGFKLCSEQIIDYSHYFIAQKIKEPVFDMSPTYGVFIKLKRVGKGGKLIRVYKFRTMHPFSEYIQDYIHENNDLDKGGKFNNDFRISTLGRIMRKLWIDEFPMFINVFKGQMKIVGVRPLSEHYFSLYPENFRAMRIKYKPGLVPPFYVDMPETLDEIIESELKYLESYDKSPLYTDIKYFFKSFYNIIIKGKRSK
jgi:lipopolysaccharide/colanic/teichoic acid biosynthesis glycosyltransferase